MPEEKQITKDQHFVPAFYLRRFTNGDGFLERLVLPTAQILSKPKRPESEAKDLFFYGANTGIEDEASQQIEEFWQGIEDFIAPRLDELTKRITANLQLTPIDEEIIALLSAMLWMRTPYFRETMNKNIGDFEKQLYQMRAGNPAYTEQLMEIAKASGKELSQEKAEELRKFILEGRYAMKFNNIPHLQFMVGELEGFRNLFSAAKWRFYIADSSRQFVTSSAPCIEVFPEPRNFAYGPSFYQRKHFIPLSPNVLAEAISPFGPGKRVKRRRVTDDEVLDYNLQQANWSCMFDKPRYSRCYATRKQELEELVAYRVQNGGEAILRAVARNAVQGEP